MNGESDPHDHALPKVVVQTPDTPAEGTPSNPEPSEAPTTAPEPIASPSMIRIARPIPPNPLRQFSLRGDGAKLKAQAVETKPLLGEFILQGQSTMIYAQPNAGKTLTAIRLCRDAIEEGRLDPNDLFFVNADDSGVGLAEKVQIFEEVGAHMIAPRRKGFKAAQFADWLAKGADEGSARGTVVVIDTLKKFTNLMDKGRSSEFANVCRDYVAAGGTIVALGHTAKNKNADGSPRYQGTTDILEDFDAVYVAELIVPKASPDQRVIRFTQQKSRANSPEVVGYAYSAQSGLTYQEKLASLRLAYPEELDGRDLSDEAFDEEEILNCVRQYLLQGHGQGQEKTVKALATMADVSRATAHRVLDRYTGADPTKHYWNFRKGDRGVRNYYLLERD